MQGTKNNWIIIPNKINQDFIKGKITANQTLFLGLILGLSSQRGYCFASNEYLKKLSGAKHKQTITNWLGKLKDMGYLKIQIIKDNNEKFIKRRIYPLFFTPSKSKDLSISNSKIHTSKSKYSHINYNNTYNSLQKKLEKYIDIFNKLFDRQFRITDGRKRKLKIRLKEYTFKEILVALHNLSKSPWHRGINDRGWQADPDFLIRNDEQIDKWLNKDIEEAKQLAKLNQKRKNNIDKKAGIDATNL